jgi:AAA domain, putative AbiEii toxin, Type IV TA system
LNYERSHNSGNSNAKDLVKNMLKELHLKGVGPAPKFDIEFGDRLNILTGDNGLGKSFILDVAWFALTGNWFDQPALPKGNDASLSTDYPQPQISLKIEDPRFNVKNASVSFDFGRYRWDNLSITPLRLGAVIYNRVNGGISVSQRIGRRPRDFNFSSHEVWHGSLKNKICNGMIADWVKWQYRPDKEVFHLLEEVIRILSHPDEEMIIGEPMRVSIDDAREIPSISLPYSNVPITHVSAGMQRILSFAYILVWIWSETNQLSKMGVDTDLDQFIFLIDEVESHLHPKWQRTILPAILKVAEILNPDVKLQVIVTTHSPMILASLEPYFEEARDKLFLFELNGTEVTLGKVPWAKQGDADNWLTSEIFGLKRPRSKEAEDAIEAAYTLMRGEDMSHFSAHLRSQEQIHQELVKVLPDPDSFWHRWLVTAE